MNFCLKLCGYFARIRVIFLKYGRLFFIKNETSVRTLDLYFSCSSHFIMLLSYILQLLK
jgi:hypothetical protein